MIKVAVMLLSIIVYFVCYINKTRIRIRENFAGNTKPAQDPPGV